MKKRKLLISTLILTFLISCSKDHDDTAIISNTNVPLTDGSYWKYDVETDGGPIVEDHLLFLEMLLLAQILIKNLRL